MERKTIGAFLSALRKANGMTQQEVADKLNVSNKTVSKWERDEGYPEIMMLPAIAELYSVSVDEILRGERITKADNEERKDTKSEERIKYLIEKATVKFKNNSIISVILGVVALILAYTIADIVYNYNALWVGYVIILILVASSIAVTLIAFNNLLSGLDNKDVIEEEYYEKTMKNSIKYVTAVTFLSVVTIIGLLLNILFDGVSMLIVSLPATAVVGGIIAYLVRSVLHKKYNIPERHLSDEQRKYRKKHIKITSVILAVVILISIISPFVGVFIESLAVDSFNFNDGVGYQYSSQEEAENEYYKLKNHVSDNTPLYNLLDEGYLEDGTYTLYVEKLGHSFIKDENGYQCEYTEVLSGEDLEFSSQEQAENFKKENVLISDYPTPDFLERNVIFNDETLTVRWQYNTNYLRGALDILEVFLLFAYIISIVIIIISVIVYFRKKKKIS
ncbi:MAG: helix-turn-helix domain-containing protein [Clostridia bacterium]|nr:helix-turn-helix domain-containing protein [Clostridia bacterium]